MSKDKTTTYLIILIGIDVIAALGVAVIFFTGH
jgi:hypothetical protein